jgi:hypothetical protein
VSLILIISDPTSQLSPLPSNVQLSPIEGSVLPGECFTCVLNKVLLIFSDPQGF